MENKLSEEQWKSQFGFKLASLLVSFTYIRFATSFFDPVSTVRSITLTENDPLGTEIYQMIPFHD